MMRMVKSGRWMAHAAGRGLKRNVYTILAGESEEKTSLARHSSR
jgi:hypothetical protein